MEAEILAYLAGVIDSDGCITTDTGKSVRVQITNKSMKLLNLARGNFGSTISVKERKTQKHNWTYEWTLHGKSAIKFLKLILPYLVVKHRQAELAIGFPYFSYPCNAGLPASVWKRREEIAERIHKLNSSNDNEQEIIQEARRDKEQSLQFVLTL